MKKTTLTVIAIVISLIMIASLAACGGNSNNRPGDNTSATPATTTAAGEPEATTAGAPEITTAGEPEATTTAGTEPEATTAAETEPEATTANQPSDADKDALYAGMIKGTDPMERYGANYALDMVGGGTTMRSVSAENGDTVASLFLTETLGYNAFKIGADSYLEAYLPGENGAVQHVLYKSSSPAAGEEEEAPLTPEDIQDMTADKEAIVSVKYLETLLVTSEKYGLSVTCDAVEVVVRETVDPEEFGEETTAAGVEPGPQYVDIPTIYYFEAATHKMVGVKMDMEGYSVEAYFPASVTVTLPQMEVTPATEEEIATVMMTILFSAMSLMGE